VQIIMNGGTRAGWRRIVASAKDWTCSACGARNKYYWRNCPNCGERRPENG
jgi:predicted RNA-binding Zn-ribbon protein involved in translation (DUF1610 family)